MARATPVAFRKNQAFTKHIQTCYRCGVAFEDGDQIMIRKRGPSYEDDWATGRHFSVAEQIKRSHSRKARAYHVETCYYVEAIVAK